MTRPDERIDTPDRGDPSDPQQSRGGQGGQGKQGERGGRLALVLALPGVFFSVSVFPLGLALDVTAIVLAARALRRARRDPGGNGKAPGAVPAIVIGAIGAAIVAILVTLLAFFSTEVRSYLDCMSGANTLESQEMCRTEFEHAIRDRFGLSTIS